MIRSFPIRSMFSRCSKFRNFAETRSKKSAGERRSRKRRDQRESSFFLEGSLLTTNFLFVPSFLMMSGFISAPKSRFSPIRVSNPFSISRRGRGWANVIPSSRGFSLLRYIALLGAGNLSYYPFFPTLPASGGAQQKKFRDMARGSPPRPSSPSPRADAGRFPP